MRFLKKRRAANAIRLAAAIIEKNSKLRRDHAEGHPPIPSFWRAVVQDFWDGAPELADAPRTPQPVLLAAAALAAAIQTAELNGASSDTDMLHGTLLMLWICERDRVGPLHELSKVDEQLFHNARAALKASWVVDFA